MIEIRLFHAGFCFAMNRRDGLARTGSEANLKLIAGGYGGLRGWIEQVERMGELKRVNGASWDVEMGAITHKRCSLRA